MKIIKNEKLIKRNGTIANWASIAGFLMVGVPVYFYIQALGQQNLENLNFTLLMVLTLGGLMSTQIGTTLGLRYGRSPRPDEKLDTALKGLQNEFSIYHYTTPVSHLLVGPAGIWILMPYHQRGQITYTKKRWRLAGGGFTQSYLRFFGFEGIGRPDIDIENETRALKKHLAKQMDETEIPEINAMLVITTDETEINAEDAPIPAMKAKLIKDFFRQKAKEKPIVPAQLAAIKAALPE